MVIRFNLKDNDYGMIMEEFLKNFFHYTRYSYNYEKYDIMMKQTASESDALTEMMLSDKIFTIQELDDINARLAEMKKNMEDMRDVQCNEFVKINKFSELINPNTDEKYTSDDIEWLNTFLMEKFAKFMHSKHEKQSEYILSNIEITIEDVIKTDWQNGEVYYYETTNRKFLNF